MPPHHQGPRDPRRLHVRPPSRRGPGSRKRGRKAQGPIAPQRPPGGHAHCRLRLIGQDLVPGRREAGSAVCQLLAGSVSEKRGVDVSVRQPSLPNGLDARMKNPVTGQRSGPSRIPGDRRPRGRRPAPPATSRAEAGCIGRTCPLPHPSPAPAVPPSAGLSRRDGEDAGPSEPPECGRRRTLCKGPPASGVSGGPGEQATHQAGGLAQC